MKWVYSYLEAGVSNLMNHSAIVRPLIVVVGRDWRRRGSCEGQGMMVRCDEEWLNRAVCVLTQVKTW